MYRNIGNTNSTLFIQVSKQILIFSSLMMLAVLVLPVMAQVGGNYDLSWNTWDGGGETFSIGGGYVLGGTIAQYDASVLALAGGNYALDGGFWYGVSIGKVIVDPDFDEDGDVDLIDFDAFALCVSGPTVPLTAGCEDKDFDGDNDVDLCDFAVYQICYSGEGNDPDPTCDD